jgi:hypothetical protein
MNDEKIELVKEFKYLGFTWADRLSLKPTVDKFIGNIQGSLGKLRWLKSERNICTKVLRLYLPTFLLVISSPPRNLTKDIATEIPSGSSTGVPLFYRFRTQSVEQHFRILFRFLCKKNSSLFYNDIFVWDDYYKRRNNHLGHFFCSRHV